MRHDCQLTGREHNFRTDRERNSYLKEICLKMGSFTSKEKCKHGTPRSVRMLYVLRLEMQRVSGATSEILSNSIAT